MAPTLYRMRSWVRARWRVVGVLWLIVAIGGGGVLLLVAGAVRTVTAPDRYSSWRGDAWDVSIEQEVGAPRTAELTALPATGRVSMASFVFGQLGAGHRGGRADALVFAGTQDALGYRLVEGHRADDRHPLGFVATRSFVRATGSHIGDRFDLTLITQAQADESGFGVASPGGPALVGTLVGVLDGPGELDDGYALALFPPTLLDQGDIGVAASVGVASLAPGATVADLRRQLDALPSAEVFGLDDAAWVSSDIRSAVNAQGQGLVVLGAVVLLAAVVVLGQLLSRQLRLSEEEASSLRSMGYTGRQLVLDAACRVVVVVLVGAVAAGSLAYLASGAFPMGFVRHVEPHPGRRLDPLVHGLGPPLLAIALLAWVVGTVVLEARAASDRRSSSLADRLAAAVPSARVSTALRFAFAPSTGRARSVAAPLIGLTLVCGVASGALTFGASLVHVVDRPAAYGVNFDAAFGEGATDTPPELRRALATSPEVGAFTLYGTTTASSGATSLGIVGMQRVRGRLEPEVLAGRLPTADDEVALGRLTARSLHVGPGDPLVVKGASGRRTMQVTGLVLVPPVNGVDEVGKGALVTSRGLRRIDPAVGLSAGVITYRSGAGPGAAKRLAAVTGVSAGQVDPPPAVVNLRRVRSIPFLLAAAVGLLAVLSLGHLMVVAVRRRRRDLAILRSLGASPRWLSAVVHWQATLVTVLVLVVAVPAGVAGGRAVYRAFIDHVGVRPDVVVPFGWLAVAFGGLVVAANLVAAVPARRGSRISPAATFSEG